MIPVALRIAVEPGRGLQKANYNPRRAKSTSHTTGRYDLGPISNLRLRLVRLHAAGCGRDRGLCGELSGI
jgi:hypothetical protein